MMIECIIEKGVKRKRGPERERERGEGNRDKGLVAVILV